MAGIDLPPPVLTWSGFVPIIAAPGDARVVALTPSPDGRALSILLEGFTAQCSSGEPNVPGLPASMPQARTATAMLSGMVLPSLDGVEWVGTLGTVRGDVVTANGAKVVFTVSIGGSGAVRAYETLPSDSRIEEAFQATLFDPGGSRRVVRDGISGVERTPLLISLLVNTICPSDAAYAGAWIDSVDLSLWTTGGR
jgi:hypothetical protein